MGATARSVSEAEPLRTYNITRARVEPRPSLSKGGSRPGGGLALLCARRSDCAQAGGLLLGAAEPLKEGLPPALLLCGAAVRTRALALEGRSTVPRPTSRQQASLPDLDESPMSNSSYTARRVRAEIPPPTATAQHRLQPRQACVLRLRGEVSASEKRRSSISCSDREAMAEPTWTAATLLWGYPWGYVYSVRAESLAAQLVRHDFESNPGANKSKS